MLYVVSRLGYVTVCWWMLSVEDRIPTRACERSSYRLPGSFSTNVASTRFDTNM